jgi:hypothetical protein
VHVGQPSVVFVCAVLFVRAAGAEVCVTAADASCHWLDLADFCSTDQQQQQQDILQLLDKQQAVISAVKLPLPILNTTAKGSSSSSSVAFWSHKVTTHRRFNEHAAVNASIWLQGPQTDCGSSTSTSTLETTSASAASASVAAEGGRYTLRIAVGTYQQQQQQHPAYQEGTNTCNGVNGVHKDEHQQQQQQQQQPPLPPASSGPAKGVWVCTRARALEAELLQALQQQQQQQQGLAPTLLQVLSDMPALLLADVTPDGCMAEYVRWVTDPACTGRARPEPQAVEPPATSSSQFMYDPSLGKFQFSRFVLTMVQRTKGHGSRGHTVLHELSATAGSQQMCGSYVVGSN